MYEYEKAFQVLSEKGASQNLVLVEDPNLVISLKTLVRGGAIVGQQTLFDADTIYYLNPERKVDNTPLNSAWTVPQYETPQDRLKRPTELKNGITRII